MSTETEPRKMPPGRDWPTCQVCGKPMRREPFALAWVHHDSGSMMCAPGAAKPDGREVGERPVTMTPEHIRYTADTLRRVCDVGGCPGNVLQRSVFAMLAELERLKSQP